MLKKIRIDQLRLGMQLHELCDAWLDHPFWKTKFVLRDPRDLQKLCASGVSECWIDTAKGSDVCEPTKLLAPRPVPAAAAASVTASAAGSAADAPLAPARSSIEEETARAAALCHRARSAVESLFEAARLRRALDTEKCLPLVEDIAASVLRNPGALVSLARLKNRDDYTFMHSVAVCALMVSLAQQLGQDEAQTREAGMAGLLHDLGKALIPLEVLNKPGPLTDAEYAIMKTHPRRAHELLQEVGAASAITLDVCLHHHERPNGQGYPNGLAGDALSMPARMGAVCDVYDAITSNRPYKDGWDPAESIARMADWSRHGQFDTGIFQRFVAAVGIYPIGSLVRLRSGRLAVVAEQNHTSLVTPRVKVFYSTKSCLPVPVELLDLSRPGCGDRVVGRESNDGWAFPHLAEFVTGHEGMRKRA